MSALPRTAVILAAGRGQRFGTPGLARPKGFIDFGDGPIVAQSVNKILACGIRDILIVTGHLAEHYRQLATAYPGIIRLQHNPHYAESGSMYSLACAREAITEDFWLLESDLVYESRALTRLAGQDAANVVLLSGATGSCDEVYAQTRDGTLCQLTKDRAAIRGEPAGELVGISRISLPCYRQMLCHADEFFAGSRHLEYEQALVAAAAVVPVTCLRLDDLAWSEIDTAEHWQRVRQQIYPLICQRELQAENHE